MKAGFPLSVNYRTLAGKKKRNVRQNVISPFKLSDRNVLIRLNNSLLRRRKPARRCPRCGDSAPWLWRIAFLHSDLNDIYLRGQSSQK